MGHFHWCAHCLGCVRRYTQTTPDGLRYGVKWFVEEGRFGEGVARFWFRAKDRGVWGAASWRLLSAKWPEAVPFIDITLSHMCIRHVWYSGEKREIILSRPLNGVAGLGWCYTEHSPPMHYYTTLLMKNKSRPRAYMREKR